MKPEFFIVFKAAHNLTITAKNIKAGFRGAGLVPFNPETVISRLDVRLWTPTPTGPPLPSADAWESQTPHDPSEALSQSAYVRNRITNHLGSSLTKTNKSTFLLVSGMEFLVTKMMLL